jgi:hypothetical protein
MAVGFPTKANWAAGDVLTASAQDDLAGTVNLLSNASATSGSQLVSNVAGTSFAYQATPSASNPVINSAFQVWQRSTSAAMGSAGAYTSADRWATYAAPTLAVMSRQVTGDTTNLPNIQYCARLTHTAGDTTTGTLNIGNSFETINSIPFVGKTITLSFYARAGATAVSSSQNVLVGRIQTGTGTDQNLESTGYTGSATPLTTSATLTTTWQRFTVSGTIATTATEMGVEFRWSTTATAGATDYVEITGVQIDIGSVALPFRTYAATYQGELAACQRYYFRKNTSGVNQARMGLGFATSTTRAQMQVIMPVQMRVTPTSVDYSTVALADGINANVVVTSIVLDSPSSDLPNIYCDVAAGLTASRSYASVANSTSGYIGFSAEL